MTIATDNTTGTTSSAQALRSRVWAKFPGGSNGEFALPPDLTTVLARGAGAVVWDHAGRPFLDLSMGWGTALVGHAHPAVVEAVARAAAQGANIACINTRALELAERIGRFCPAAERLRFCASGTEATEYAVRLARAATGRPAILKFVGAYHGANAVGTAALFPDSDSHGTDAPGAMPPHAAPTSAGFAPDALRQTYAVPFNNHDAATDAIRRLGDRLAAVIVEPLHRCTPPEPGFLEALREHTRRNNALLIFDEVVTGFRLAMGGAQAYYGVVPDLAAYGKALGGGLPIGVIAGRAPLLDYFCEDRLHRDDAGPYVWSASSLGGNPVSCAAALAALDVLETPGTYDRLHQLGRDLRQRIDSTLSSAGLDASATGDGPLAQIAFHTGESHQSGPAATRLRKRLLIELFRRGVFVNPLGTKLYLSIAHTEADLDTFTQHLADALAAVKPTVSP